MKGKYFILGSILSSTDTSRSYWPSIIPEKGPKDRCRVPTNQRMVVLRGLGFNPRLARLTLRSTNNDSRFTVLS